MFTVEHKKQGKVIFTNTLSLDAAARFIEGWAGIFSNKEPTDYGVKLSTRHLKTFNEGEIQVMENTERNGSKHKLSIAFAG